LDDNTQLTADIVIAFVSHNTIAASDVPALIRSTYDALGGLHVPAALPEPELVPAVSIRASVKPDRVTCLECGWQGKMLKRHIRHQHCLDEATYRARWKLSADHPLVAPDYANVRRNLAKSIGLGRLPKKGRGR
jgi:predicted transcriptional regulator